MKRLILIGALLLSACTHRLTAEQSLYATFGGLTAAVESFNEYAKGPTADPKVVKRASDFVTTNEFSTARAYARSYMLCDGSSAVKRQYVDCSIWDFRPQTAAEYAITVRSALQLLRAR